MIVAEQVISTAGTYQPQVSGQNSDPQQVGSCNTFDILNDTPLKLYVTFGRNNDRELPIAPFHGLFGYQPSFARKMRVGQSWDGNIVIRAVTPQGGSGLLGAPASELTIVGYSAPADPDHQTSFALARAVNVGQSNTTVNNTNQIVYDPNAINGETANSVKSTAAAGGAAPLVDVTDANPTGGKRKFVMATGEVDINGDGSVTLPSFSATKLSTVALGMDGEAIGANGQSAYIHLGSQAQGPAGTIVSNQSIVAIVGGGSFFGVRRNDGTKLLEAKNDGSLEMGQNLLHYPQSTTVLNWSQAAFDTFDVAELFPVDPAEELRGGEVVCPGASGVYRRCPHGVRGGVRACPHALIVSARPGLRIGQLPKGKRPRRMVRYLAIAGRVRVRVEDPRDVEADFLVSAGNGFACGLARGRWGHALGTVIPGSYNAKNGTLGIVVRPQYVRGTWTAR